MPLDAGTRALAQRVFRQLGWLSRANLELLGGFVFLRNDDLVAAFARIEML